jgi:hypothetical protein
LEVWGECRIRSSVLAEFGGKGEGSKNRLHKPVEENENEKIIRF